MPFTEEMKNVFLFVSTPGRPAGRDHQIAVEPYRRYGYAFTMMFDEVMKQTELSIANGLSMN